jgi:hypothetical protein
MNALVVRQWPETVAVQTRREDPGRNREMHTKS